MIHNDDCHRQDTKASSPTEHTTLSLPAEAAAVNFKSPKATGPVMHHVDIDDSYKQSTKPSTPIEPAVNSKAPKATTHAIIHVEAKTPKAKPAEPVSVTPKTPKTEVDCRSFDIFGVYLDSGCLVVCITVKPLGPRTGIG